MRKTCGWPVSQLGKLAPRPHRQVWHRLVLDLANVDDRGRLGNGEPTGCDRRPVGVGVWDQEDAGRLLGKLLDQGERARACIAGAVDDGEAGVAVGDGLCRLQVLDQDEYAALSAACIACRRLGSEPEQLSQRTLELLVDIRGAAERVSDLMEQSC